MPTLHIAFLRAVNVGGRVVKMTRLRALFEELGLSNVRTFIQSGNVFFTTAKKDRAALERRITAHLTGALGYEVPTMIRTLPELEASLALDPFRAVKVTPDVRLCVVFTSAPLPADLALPLHDPKQGLSLIRRTQGEGFIVLTQTNGRAGNPAAFLEKTFKVKATTRFYGTLGKLVIAAKGE